MEWKINQERKAMVLTDKLETIIFKKAAYQFASIRVICGPTLTNAPASSKSPIQPDKSRD